MAEYRFRQPKSVEDEERCVLNAIPKSTRYKNKWAARIFEEWGKARFPKVATLEPGGLCETIIFSYYLLSFVVNKVMFFYLANMQIKKICIRVSGQVDEFRNPMKTELKTRPCLKAMFSTRFSLDF